MFKKIINKFKISSQNIIFKPDNVIPILIVFVGLLSGFIAVLFRELIVLFEHTFYFLYTPYGQKINYLVIPIFISLLAGFLLYKYFPLSRGSGIPEIKNSLFYNYGIVPLKELWGKLITGVLCISAGLAVGREGPTIFITGTAGSWFGRMFKIKRSNIKNLVVCGSAGGLAAAFNTPITAVTFVIEELLGNLSTKIVSATIISCVLAATVARMMLGNIPTLDVPAYPLLHPLELIFFVLLGIFCGLLSVLFVKTMLGATTVFNKSGIHKAIIPIIGGIFIGISAYFMSADITGFGYTSKSASSETEINLSENNSIQNNKNKKQIVYGPAESIYKQIEDVTKNVLDKKLIITLLIFKFIAVILCYTTGAAGGIFAPTIFIGAMAGGSLGILFHSLFPSLTNPFGAYALVGMGAFFSGVMKTPITSILLIFELTHNYNIILPLMAANMVSFSVSKFFHKESIYDSLLKLKGIHFPAKSVDFNHFLVRDAMTTPVTVITDSMTVGEAENLFQKTKSYYSYPVVNKNNKLCGLLRRHMIRQYVFEEKLDIQIKDIVKGQKVPMLFENDTLDTALRLFASFEMTVIPVVNNKKFEKIVGIIAQKDIIRFYNENSIED